MRPNKDQYFMAMAILASTRSTCRRRAVGAVIIDHLDRIISTGYNGVPSQFPHCFEQPCAGAHAASGESLDACLAIHAETNAVAHCLDIRQAEAIYCTTQPCVQCTKLLLSTPIKRIVFLEPYKHEEAEYLWIESGRTYEAWQELPERKSAADVFTSIGLDFTDRATQLLELEDTIHRHRD